jgi:metallo-beta-lactamase class B
MCTRCSFLGGVAAFSLAPIAALARTGDPQALEVAMPSMERIDDTLWLGQVSRNVWIHSTTHVIGGNLWYPANGLIVVDGNEATLIDTGWTPDQAGAILKAWSARKRPPITKAIATHFHYDRVGGIPLLNQRGIPTYGNPTTIGLAIDRGFAPPKPIHELDRKPHSFGSMELYFPGAGHTIDNIVVWIPSDDILFGGCLVKSTTATDLGNMDDGDVVAYPRTMKTLIARYRPGVVVPGHGTIAGDSMNHTLRLAELGK